MQLLYPKLFICPNHHRAFMGTIQVMAQGKTTTQAAAASFARLLRNTETRPALSCPLHSKRRPITSPAPGRISSSSNFSNPEVQELSYQGLSAHKCTVAHRSCPCRARHCCSAISAASSGPTSTEIVLTKSCRSKE